MSPLLRLVAAGLVVAALARPAAAQQMTFWFPPGDGNWFNANNWTFAAVTNPYPPPDGVNEYAAFGSQTGNPTRTITVDGTPTVGYIRFSSSFVYTLNGGGLTLDSTISRLIDKTSTGLSTINTPLTIAGATNTLNLVNANATGLLSLASLAGTGSTVVVNNYAGTLSPGNANGTGLVEVLAGSYGGAGSVTRLVSGVLRATDGVGLPTNTYLEVQTSGYWEQNAPATVTRTLGTATGQLSMTGNVGLGAFNGPLTLSLNGGAAVQWGQANFTPTRVQFGRGVTAGGNDLYTWTNPIDLNGATRTVAAGIGAGVRATLRLTGNLTNSAGTAGGLTVTTAGGAGAVVELTGVNTFDGPTTVQGLTALRAVDGQGLSPNSNLVLQAGIVESPGAATFTRPLGTGPGQFRIVAGSTSGFSAFGGTHTVSVGGATPTPLVWGATDFNPGVLRLGSDTATGLTDFRNPLDLNNATRQFDVRNNSASTTDVARVSGVISNSGPANSALVVVATGTGFLELAGANTYNLQTAVVSSLAGAGLRLVGGGSFANSPVVTVDVGEVLDVSQVTSGANFSVAAGRFLLAPGQQLAGTGTVTGGVLVGPGASVRGGSPATVLNQPTGQLAVTGPLRLVGSAGGTSAALQVDLTGATASGATVSRVAVTGVLDLASTAGPLGSAVVVRLANDGGLAVGQTYSFTVASASDGFTRDGNPVVGGYTFGGDFTLESATFAAFTGVSLTTSGANLVLTFTPVPEPGLLLAAAAGGLLARRRFS